MAVQFTSSMHAQAEVLLARASRWARGERNKDGMAFFLFSSSRTTKDGTPIYHKTRADGGWCSCPSFEYRQACSHALAAQMNAERQARHDAESDALFAGYTKHVVKAAPVALAPTKPTPRFSRGYADLYGPDDDTVDAY